MEGKTVKFFKRSDLKKSSDSKTTLVIIHNTVYDLTQFLNEHPGGEEVLLDHVGKDATEAFEDVGHSKDARDMMIKYKVGELVEEDRTKTTEKTIKDWVEKKSDEHSSWKSWMIPITLAVLATIIYRYYFHCH